MMFNNAIYWATHLENPTTMAIIGVLVILFHAAFRPNIKHHIECIEESNNKNRKPARTKCNHVAFLFEVCACAAIVYSQGINVFTMLICFWSFVTWIPSYIFRIRYVLKKRKFDKMMKDEA